MFGPGSCVLVLWGVNTAQSLTPPTANAAVGVNALSKVEGNPLFRHKAYI